MTPPAVKTRFAPSPTGLLHLGNLRTALFNVLLARAAGGRFCLRIEDSDAARSETRYLDALLEDLRWLGLDWDEGPGDGQPESAWRQAERGGVYAPLFERLEEAGAAYPCFCSAEALAEARARQRAAGQPPRYPGTCAAIPRAEARRRLAAGEAATLRFRVPAARRITFDDGVRGPQAFASADLGDFVIRRTDGTAAFLFGNAVDDALGGITHVLRGEDHLANTPRQLLLLQALGFAAPVYAHLPMIVGDDGAPLSKRHGAGAVAELRAAGYRPEALLNYLARLGYQPASDELLDLDGLARGFRLAALGRAPARFDGAQLDHWQERAMAVLPVAALTAWLPADLVPSEAREALVATVRPNLRFPQELADWARRLYDPAPLTLAADAAATLVAAGPGFFDAVSEVIAASPGAGWDSLRRALAEATGCRGRALFLPLRLALTGVPHGPGLGELLDLMPDDIRRARLERARELAANGTSLDASDPQQPH
ncbi:glutamate--tRNA ligase [Sediminicurvatus halobius]|uniref:Glutamate--tRNA ligase n=1 Tax=Sediminicurvatus halobius TaxID=2182432 RepID=A0A2U2N5W5_9GAMM|nr:glutamate--tRNA ligase [Spiribacter halobius]PWG64615.1 glutamate--tRNA ligase [Spiribacter halobius]UEX79062.1 glutamate--tRNA ligase [Spiribacter halobius]